MLPLLLIAALALSVPAPDARATAAADSRERAAAQPQDDAAKLKAELITKLLGLATWCNDKELFLQRDNVWRSVLALESEMNRYMPLYPQVILCLYDLERFGGGVVVDLLKTHPRILMGGMVIENPYCLTPDELLGMEDVVRAGRTEAVHDLQRIMDASQALDRLGDRSVTPPARSGPMASPTR